MPQTDRTIQDTLTSLPPADVITAAKRFFARQNSVYTAFIDEEGPDYLTLRGAGTEEIAIGAIPQGGVTRVTASTYLYDQQLARFLTTLPGPTRDPSRPHEIPQFLPDSKAAVIKSDSVI